MKKIMIGMAGLLLLAGQAARGQDLKLDELLSKYFQSAGTAKEETWKTLVFEGRTVNQGSEYPYKVYLKRPGMIRTETEIQGTKSIGVWDGSSGWSITPWAGSLTPQDMTPDESKDLMNQAEFEGRLYHWKEKGFQVELVGREDLEGTQAYNIKLTRTGGDTENYFIDAKHYILLKIAYHTLIMGHPQDHEVYTSNYRQVEGVFLPFVTVDRYPGQVQEWGGQVVYDRILVNQPLSDSLFLKPVIK
jgi:outer membrane lipoprotein-sorting protein